MSKLTLADIADLRAYERERDEFRRHIIDIKRVRRVGIGPVVSLTFENSETMRFQVQEMVRVEKMLTDGQVQGELDTYNALIPDPGQLCATLFIELVTDEELRYWLPKLVGIEHSVVLHLGNPDVIGAQGGAETVRCATEAEHQAALTRDQITASVHYITFSLTGEQVDRFATGPVTVAIDHPAYPEATMLSEETRLALLEDVRHGG